jgi:manganese/zinc/iron transport system substrate-binding protein
MARSALALAALLVALLAAGCSAALQPATPAELAERRLRVATTTNFITDLAREVGGPRVEVTGLMGPGVDPHLFRASARDVQTLREADLVLYGGLELEGRMADLLAELGRRQPTLAVTRDLPRAALRREQAGKFDPHVWFDPTLWMRATRTVGEELARLDPAHAEGYRARTGAYLRELRALDREVRERLEAVPPRRRVLVTSHDAFGYFGARYGLEVLAIQGISTQTEATTADIERIARVLAERGLPAVFIESSVPRQTIEAVLAAAERRGQRARVGGELFADAAGDEGTPEGTYVGMLRYNARVIAEGLGS